MTYIIPKIGDEYAFIGDDFVGVAFLKIREKDSNEYLFVDWEDRKSKAWWSTCLLGVDFNPSHDNIWNLSPYKVVKVESEKQKLMLKLKHG
jgi:hypothetical protein